MTTNIKVKFKLLNNHAVLPTYATYGDAGLDLTATDDGKYEAVEAEIPSRFYAHNETATHKSVYREYGTGVSVEIPEGYVGLLFPRSSITRTSLSLSNAVGVVDSGYRGEVKLRFRVLEDHPLLYKRGDKIGQLVIMPYPKIEVVDSTELKDSERGVLGFGSSGR